jgi:dolichol-phosphate mannosyltransferase
MPESPHISAVVPAYNEAESLPALIDELSRALDTTGSSYEIVLVDDGSTDGSGVWIANAARSQPHVRAVLLERNAGQSAALAAGLRHARGEVLVTLDADGQNDPADIPRLLEALRDADVASGVRTDRADTWVRKVSSRIANAVRRMALGDTITDIGCSLKAYRRSAVEGIPFFVGAHRFLPALCQFRGARVVEIPVRHRPRTRGVSKYGVGNRLFRGIRDLFGVRWLKARMPRDKVRQVIGE